MYRYYNPNPKRADGLDCVVRAISKLTGATTGPMTAPTRKTSAG